MPETDETLKIVMNFNRIMMSNKNHSPQQLHRLRTCLQQISLLTMLHHR